MSREVWTRLLGPVGQVPNAHWSEGIGILGATTSSRTVKVAFAGFRSPASQETKLGLPSRVRVNVPSVGIVRSEYSIRISEPIGPSGLRATGRLGNSRAPPGATSPC